MAETIEKTKQYKYQVNANLVITRDNTGPRDAVHTTGESSTLSVHSYETLKNEMGRGAQRGRNEEIEKLIKTQREQSRKKNRQVSDTELQASSFRRQQQRRLNQIGSTNVLDSSINAYYRPTTTESRAAYEAIMKFIEQKYGMVPTETMQATAHWIITILKDPQLATSRQKMKELNSKVFTHSKVLSDQELAKLIKLVNTIGDFDSTEDDYGSSIVDNANSNNTNNLRSGSGGGGVDGENLFDSEKGVAIQFGDDTEDQPGLSHSDAYTYDIDPNRTDILGNTQLTMDDLHGDNSGSNRRGSRRDRRGAGGGGRHRHDDDKNMVGGTSAVGIGTMIGDDDDMSDSQNSSGDDQPMTNYDRSAMDAKERARMHAASQKLESNFEELGDENDLFSNNNNNNDNNDNNNSNMLTNDNEIDVMMKDNIIGDNNNDTGSNNNQKNSSDNRSNLVNLSSFEIEPKEIDAYWLQRQIKENYPSFENQHAKAERILKALSKTSLRDIEREVLNELGLENYGFVQKLFKNKDVIVWCTKLKRANLKDRKEIELEMSNDPKLARILEELRRTHGTEEERKKKAIRSIVRESQSMKKKSSDESASEEDDDDDIDDDTAVTTGMGLMENEENDGSNVDNNNNVAGTRTTTTKGMTMEDMERERLAKREQLILNAKLGKKGKKFLNTDYSDSALWSQQYSKYKRELNLDGLAFRESGHTNTNTEWEIKNVQERINHKGWDEVIVPFIQTRDEEINAENRPRKPISEMPQWSQYAFEVPSETNPDEKIKRTHLNEVQTKCFDCAFNTSENLLLCAPTGAGKTNVAMLTILRCFAQHMEYVENDDETDDNNDNNDNNKNENGMDIDENDNKGNNSKKNNKQNWRLNKDKFKIVYIAPMKSLVREVVQKFQARLHDAYGVNVAELSGDQQLSKEQIAETQIIVTTPEKWDIITRKGMDRSYTQLVKLIIIDEIHLLHDSRGPVLESIVTRTIRSIEETMENIRIVGLSATLPNYRDIAIFLRVNLDKGLFYFDASYRPIPLIQRFAGITLKNSMRQWQLMNDICYRYMIEQMKTPEYQCIIFVHSRKETFSTASYLIDQLKENDMLNIIFPDDSPDLELLREEANKEKENGGIQSDNLRDILPYGFGIHHAGMDRSDRALVEDLFRSRSIRVLVSTATLAWGVNMPAHGVIIKGTKIYNPEKGKWMELSMLDILQMFGRAGRPDTGDQDGEAYLITTLHELNYYMPLLNEQLPIESQMISKLPDVLNAEIVLGTVQNLKDCVNWMQYTYLYIRMMCNPSLYDINDELVKKDANLVQRRIDLCHTALLLLSKNGLIKYNSRYGHINCTFLGRIAAYYYISHDTIYKYNSVLKATMSDIEIFRVFSQSGEFNHMNVREGEKEELAKLFDKVPIPIKEAIDEPSAKVNVLLQAYIARLKLDGYLLKSDMVYITQNAGRLMRALFEITLQNGWSNVSQRCLELCKMIEHRQWSIESPLRQFYHFTDKLASIGQNILPYSIIRRLEKANFAWERYFHLKANEIGELIGLRQWGQDTFKMVHQIPKISMMGTCQPITRNMIRIEIELRVDFDYLPLIHGNSEEFWLIVEDVNGETILHYEYIIIKKSFALSCLNNEDVSQLVYFYVPICDPIPPQYFVRIISDKWLGSETVLPITFRSLILPNRNELCTELLDLQSIETSYIKEDICKVYFYNENFKQLTAIQTQIFDVLYGNNIYSKQNMLLCSPTRSGKTTCAEIAICKIIDTYYNESKIVYVVPHIECALKQYNVWKEKFVENKLMKKVLKEKYGFGKSDNDNDNDDEDGDNESEEFSIYLLCGDKDKDKKALANGNIIISIPEYWDNLTRSWQKLENYGIYDINLFICDNLHLVGTNDGFGANGSVYEIIVSRMLAIRHSEKLKEYQYENDIDASDDRMRIIGLSVPIANYKNVGKWLHCKDMTDTNKKTEFTFNFNNLARIIKQDIELHTSDINNIESRAISFIKPMYNEIIKYIDTSSYRKQQRAKMNNNNNNNKQDIKGYRNDNVLIWVSNVRNCKRLAMDLIALASSDNNPNRFLNVTVDLEKVINVESITKDGILIESLKHGIGYLHSFMSEKEKSMVETLYDTNAISIIIVEHRMTWQLNDQIYDSNMVIVFDTQYYNGYLNTYMDYSLPNIIEMIGKANRQRNDFTFFLNNNNSHVPTSNDEIYNKYSTAKVILFCHKNKKRYFEKFLFEPFPIESRLTDGFDFCDMMNSDIVNGIISHADHAMDALTWCLYYCRIQENPTYYQLKDTRQDVISQFLSEMVEQCFNDLFTANCINVEAETWTVTPLNIGGIASHYYIRYATIEFYSKGITSKSSIKDILHILSYSNDFEEFIYIESDNEAKIIDYLLRKLKYGIDEESHSIATKVFTLLQTYFERNLNLKNNILFDRNKIVCKCINLLYAMIDVASTMEYLDTCLKIVKVCQMITQGLWHDKKYHLLQLPHINKNMIDNIIRTAKYDYCSDVAELYDMDDKLRNELFNQLKLTKNEIKDIAMVCNKFPSLDVECKVLNENNMVAVNEFLEIEIYLIQDDDDEDDDEDDDSDDSDESDESGSDNDNDDDNNGNNEKNQAKLERKKRKEEKKAKQLKKKLNKKQDVPLAYCPYFPQNEVLTNINNPREEEWIIIIGDKKSKKTLTVKRVKMDKCAIKKKMGLAIPRGNAKGEKEYDLSLVGTKHIYDITVMSLCYMGVDLQTSVEFTIGDVIEESEYDDEEEEEESDDNDQNNHDNNNNTNNNHNNNNSNNNNDDDDDDDDDDDEEQDIDVD